MLRACLLSLLCVLPGCALMQPSADMSAAQLTALSKDKSAAVTCTTIIGAWGTARLVTISMDQNSIKDGGISVDGERGCTAAINSVSPPRAPVTPTPKVAP